MTLLDVSIRDRINACWIGKSVGGTMGLPYEGHPGPLDLWFYTPMPSAMLPNDDLDLQVAWACVLRDMSQPRISRHVLAKAWERHIEFPFDEYAIAKRNMRLGLQPPETGSYDNWFANGMGAAIRTELWACLAPGNPELAAAFAYEDACVDHAGEGIWAAMFLAALQGMAFVESDPDLLLDRALEQIPEHSLIHQAVTDVRLWTSESDDWLRIRSQILEKYDHENFTDVTANIAFIVMSWLLARDDFSRAICIANNCGRDTDCTAATVGALIGIIDPTAIDDRWTAPIGDALVLSPEIRNLNNVPKTLHELTDLILSVHDRMTTHQPPADRPSSVSADGFCVRARIAFVSELPADHQTIDRLPESAWSQMSFDGTMASLPGTAFKDQCVVLKFAVSMAQAERTRIMFNTAQACRVWIDGVPAFERKSGIVSPSLHRTAMLINQHKDVSLDRGMHVITAAVKGTQSSGAAWVFGAGIAKTRQWLPQAIYTTR